MKLRCVVGLNNFNRFISLGIDYVGALGLGTFLGSSSFFILYGLITMNRPQIPSPSTVLPALLSGLLSGGAQSCWLVANEALQAAITYPIASSLPGAIAAIIGTVFFKEVQVSIRVINHVTHKLVTAQSH